MYIFFLVFLLFPRLNPHLCLPLPLASCSISRTEAIPSTPDREPRRAGPRAWRRRDRGGGRRGRGSLLFGVESVSRSVSLSFPLSSGVCPSLFSLICIVALSVELVALMLPRRCVARSKSCRGTEQWPLLGLLLSSWFTYRTTRSNQKRYRDLKESHVSTSFPYNHHPCSFPPALGGSSAQWLPTAQCQPGGYEGRARAEQHTESDREVEDEAAPQHAGDWLHHFCEFGGMLLLLGWVAWTCDSRASWEGCWSDEMRSASELGVGVGRVSSLKVILQP